MYPLHALTIRQRSIYDKLCHFIEIFVNAMLLYMLMLWSYKKQSISVLRLRCLLSVFHVTLEVWNRFLVYFYPLPRVRQTRGNAFDSNAGCMIAAHTCIPLDIAPSLELFQIVNILSKLILLIIHYILDTLSVIILSLLNKC